MRRLTIDLTHPLSAACLICGCATDGAVYAVQVNRGKTTLRCERHLAQMLAPPREDLLRLTCSDIEKLIYEKLGWPTG